MHKLVAGIFIRIAVAVMSQDRAADVAVSGSPVPEFASLETFVRGLAMANREVAVYWTEPETSTEKPESAGRTVWV